MKKREVKKNNFVYILIFLYYAIAIFYYFIKYCHSNFIEMLNKLKTKKLNLMKNEDIFLSLALLNLI